MSSPVAGWRITSIGIKYSNIDPDQLSRAAPPPTAVTPRPSRVQWRVGRSFLAIATKLPSRASEAIRS